MKIEFSASIHSTPAALRFGGDGAFLTFAVPETDKQAAIKLIYMQGKNLKITIEEEDD
jgi:hypothetical protein